MNNKKKSFFLFKNFLVHRTQTTKNRVEVKMYRNWNNVLKAFLIFLVIILLNTRHVALAEDEYVSNEGSDVNLDKLQLEQLNDAQIAKRSWKQLQGGWGKRAFGNSNGLTKNYQTNDYLDEGNRNNDYDTTSRLKNTNFISDSDDDYDGTVLQKRAWKSMSGAWGKRDWNPKQRGGKREQGNWNNLRGLWGKRSSSPQNWRK